MARVPFGYRIDGDNQAATVAVNVLPFLEAEAKERQLSTLKQNASAPLVKNLTNGFETDRNETKAAAQAAALVGTNRTYVAKAKALQQSRPDLYRKVAAGQTTIDKAAKQQKREAERERLTAEVAAVVVRIFSEFCRPHFHTGLSEIAHDLNVDGVPTQRGGKWHASTVRYILGNQVYAEAPHAIISRGAYDQAQSRLASMQRGPTR